MIIVVASCSSQKQITTTTATANTSAIEKLDSLFQKITIAEDVDIAWTFDEDPNENAESNKTQSETPIKPSAKSPPKKGAVHIRISKRAESIKTQTKAVKKSKQQLTKKDKKKEKKKKETKIVKNNIWSNALFIIIFVFCVKYVFEHKNNLKKVWNLLKKKLTLQHL